MKSLDNIAEDLFNKIRGRFPSITIGNNEGKVTNDPLTARFFDFDYQEGEKNVGKVSISISEDKLSVMYSNSFVENEDTLTRQNWYNFLKELRIFAKKRLLQFDTRDITKSNLDKRDYKFLANQQGEEKTMSESTSVPKLYGTSKVSYQDVGNARLTIKHTEGVNQELSAARTKKIGAIYVENTDGERFKYPFKHLNGARAMARHVAEGGKPYDDFGKHITGLSEELANLRKFKTYMNRSSVMAEGLAGYMGAVVERLDAIKKTVTGLQKESYYKTAFESYEVPMMEDVPNDVAENWIDELTIRQFNEDLKDVFPFVYKLVGEATKAQEITPEDMLGEKMSKINASKYTCEDCGCQMHNCKSDCDCSHDSHDETGSWWKDENGNGIPDIMESTSDVCEDCGNPSWSTFTEGSKSWKQTSMDPKDAIAKFGKDNVKIKKGGLNNGDDMIEILVDSVEEAHGNSSEYDKCWKGYSRVPGTARGEEGSCKKNESEDALSDALDDVMGQFSDKPQSEPKLEPKKPQTPVTEFILSLFDRETGQFPKGETAVLTAIEKDYGEQFITPAKGFIEAISAKYEQFKDPDFEQIEPQMDMSAEEEAFAPEDNYSTNDFERLGNQGKNEEFNDIKRLAGL
tara:strand:- start:143 stop:2032 length:1890 start_codon:yes stop_codon:yes gene_type:complete